MDNYKVRKMPKQERYCIYRKETGERVGCSDTRNKALASAHIREAAEKRQKEAGK